MKSFYQNSGAASLLGGSPFKKGGVASFSVLKNKLFLVPPLN
jgi:hypothetical protein